MAICRAFLGLCGCHVYGKYWFAHTLSVITYKQSKFSLEDKKYSKSLRCGQILLRGILDQELAHQPLSFACLLGGPRWLYHIRGVSKSPALKGHCHWKESRSLSTRIGQKPQNGCSASSCLYMHEPPWRLPGGFIISCPIGILLGIFHSLASSPGLFA